VVHHVVRLHVRHLGPHLGEVVDLGVLEKVLHPGVLDCAVLDLGLLRQVGHRLVTYVDRGGYFLDGEEGGQVGCVRGDKDEGEEPPGAGLFIKRHPPPTLHKRAQDEPEGLPDGHWGEVPTGLSVQTPAHPLQAIQNPGHDQEGGQDDHPHHGGERAQELEVGRLVGGHAHQHRDVSCHERLGEVHSALPVGVDGQGRHGHCGFNALAHPSNQLSNNAVPLSVGHLAAKLAVVDQIEVVVEVQLFGHILDEIYGETLKLVIARSGLVVFFEH
ncbi:hypothetical protein EGW08_018007, partial [Elysia chlorotica]